jgi:hypothetical protein
MNKPLYCQVKMSDNERMSCTNDKQKEIMINICMYSVYGKCLASQIWCHWHLNVLYQLYISCSIITGHIEFNVLKTYKDLCM